MDLHQSAAIVTGAGSGLGAATAAALAAGGARVALLDVNFDAAHAKAAEIGDVAVAIACDVTSADGGAAALKEASERHGVARILVNCAGVGTAKRIVGRHGAMALEDFNRVIQVNLVGSFNMMRLAAAAMAGLEPQEDGERGVIISTASIAAYEGQVGQAAYSASKGGIVSLTLPAARELAQFGIRVLAIAPGLFRTPMLLGLPPDTQRSLGESIPFPRRLGDPAEYARLVLHCVANRALNGEVIRLDGALRMAAR